MSECHRARPELRPVGKELLVLERLVGERGKRGVDRIDGSVADENIDRAETLAAVSNERFDLRLVRDVAGNGGGLPAALLDVARDLLARRELAARDHHLGAERRHAVGDGAADAAARSGDDRDLVVKMERRRHW